MTSSVWRRQQKYFVTGLFLGAELSGLLAGILGGLLAPLPQVIRLPVMVTGVAVIVAFELAGRPLSLPQNRRAVPQTVIPRAQVEGPLQFGFEMGTGVRTFMPTALPHAVVVAIALAGNLGPGLLAGLGFGLGRALMPLVRSRQPDPAAWDTRLLVRLRLVGRVCALGFAIAIVALLWSELDLW